MVGICQTSNPLNFYPRPPRGGRQTKAESWNWTDSFLSTPSARRATFRRGGGKQSMANFYPRPPRGGRPKAAAAQGHEFLFLSTPSARRATVGSLRPGRRLCNFYPRPPRGGRQGRFCAWSCRPRISIHALREEGDLERVTLQLISAIFLSTPSARRATVTVPAPESFKDEFLSTPSARRATNLLPGGRYFRDISIHALREEGDGKRTAGGKASAISIHALREEGDSFSCRGNSPATHFYPRPPRGGRRRQFDDAGQLVQFLSTPSARRATGLDEPAAGMNPSARRATSFYLPRVRRSGDFYPRPPRGGRRLLVCRLSL